MSSTNKRGFVLINTLLFLLFASSFISNKTGLLLIEKQLQHYVVLMRKSVQLQCYVINQVKQFEELNTTFSKFGHTITLSYHNGEIFGIVSGELNFSLNLTVDLEKKSIKSYNYSGIK